MSNSIPALVTPSVLKWARNLDDLTLNEVAEKLKIKIDLLESWEKGDAQPTLVQAKKLAKCYRVPFAFFFLPDEPKKVKRLEKIDFRTFDNSGMATMSRELKWFLRDIEERRDAVIELYETNDWIIPNPNLGFDVNQNITIDTYLRKYIGYTENVQKKFRSPEVALRFAIEALENKGFLIFQASKVPTEEMRGLSIAYDEFPIIALNRKDEPSARLFTLFHELVHILTNTSAICNQTTNFTSTQNQTEMFCNQIAGLALVPETILIKNHQINNIRQFGFKDAYVSSIARDFAVSKEVIINRLWKIGIITKDEYFNTLSRYSEEYLVYKQTKKKDGFIAPAIDKGTQVGKLYSRAVLVAYNNERINAVEASNYLLGLRPKHFERLERWCF